MALVLTLTLGGTVYSLFSKELGINAIGDNNSLFASIVVEEPVEIEEQPKPKKNDEGGGGGGGGKEEPEPASKGRLVSQSEKPINPPDAKLPQLTNPDIKIIQETKGNIKRPITAERAGLPGSDNLNPSNGRGTGGGIGSGSGTGIGSGNGTGEGSGNGSGSGNGNGNGNGDGRGDGSGGTRTPPPPPPQPKPVEVVSEPFKIISKPRATYTDAARQNQVTGVVRLRVTFSASGSIGSIAPVSGLPYGLTEQAIAAARQIRFEPAKKNGVPVASTKIIEYSFTIY
jgi:TonB family protein